MSAVTRKEYVELGHFLKKSNVSCNLCLTLGRNGCRRLFKSSHNLVVGQSRQEMMGLNLRSAGLGKLITSVFGLLGVASRTDEDLWSLGSP